MSVIIVVFFKTVTFKSFAYVQSNKYPTLVLSPYSTHTHLYIYIHICMYSKSSFNVVDRFLETETLGETACNEMN